MLIIYKRLVVFVRLLMSSLVLCLLLLLLKVSSFVLGFIFASLVSVFFDRCNHYNQYI